MAILTTFWFLEVPETINCSNGPGGAAVGIFKN
jgi:hypothetical protein